MRVITGSAKGHRLKAPRDMGTRPMLDRVKEALFAILEGYDALHGQVLDLYAGTGSLGIESLSRGASAADFVEQRTHVCAIIRENLEHTHLAERGQVFCMPVQRFLQGTVGMRRYAIIFMDPPYADPAITETLMRVAVSGMLDHESVLVVGHAPNVELADQYPGIERLKYRRLGDSCFSIYAPTEA